MSLTKETAVDQITVTEEGLILYREVTRIIEDGVLLTHKYHRTTLVPGQDLEGHPDKVATIANAAWTPEIVSVYKAQLAANTTPTE